MCRTSQPLVSSRHLLGNAGMPWPGDMGVERGGPFRAVAGVAVFRHMAFPCYSDFLQKFH